MHVCGQFKLWLTSVLKLKSHFDMTPMKLEECVKVDHGPPASRRLAVLLVVCSNCLKINEAVDVLAGQACAGLIQVSSRHITQIICQLRADSISCQWMWLVHRAAWNDPSLPRLDTTTRELIIPPMPEIPVQ